MARGPGRGAGLRSVRSRPCWRSAPCWGGPAPRSRGSPSAGAARHACRPLACGSASVCSSRLPPKVAACWCGRSQPCVQRLRFRLVAARPSDRGRARGRGRGAMDPGHRCRRRPGGTLAVRPGRLCHGSARSWRAAPHGIGRCEPVTVWRPGAAGGRAHARSARGIDPELQQRFADAGLVHLLSISGFHVGLITAWVFLVGRLAPAGPPEGTHAVRRGERALRRLSRLAGAGDPGGGAGGGG